MAVGILASSASVTMAAALGADSVNSGYVTGEQVTLATSPAPAGASYAWAIAKPAGSTVLSDLTQATAASPAFTPDVAGFYVLTVTVNSVTVYVLRCSVTATVRVTVAESIRVPPKADAGVLAPPSGEVLFYSLAANRWRVKNSAGVVRDWQPAIVMFGTSLLANADAGATIADGNLRFMAPATLTGNHTLTLGTAGAVLGDWVTVTRYDVTAWTYAVVNGGPGAGTMVTLPVSEAWFADFQFNGTDWLLVRAGQMP
jgi:hypothetical protein